MLEWLTKTSTLELVIWSIFIGIIVGVFAVFYTRRILGSLIRRLLENECLSKDSARSLEELGLSKNFLIKNSLKKGILSKAVEKTETEGAEKLYIKEEKRHSTELRFSGKDTDVFGIIIALAVFIAVAFALTRLVPYITSLLGDIV